VTSGVSVPVFSSAFAAWEFAVPLQPVVAHEPRPAVAAPSGELATQLCFLLHLVIHSTTYSKTSHDYKLYRSTQPSILRGAVK